MFAAFCVPLFSRTATSLGMPASTLLLALGSFTGGALRLWPGDGGGTEVSNLKVADAKVVELEHRKGEPYLFDGNCAQDGRLCSEWHMW